MTTKAPPPGPGPEHRRLGMLIGTWNTEGRTIDGPFGPAIRISGTDGYEWLPGEFFLVHRVDVQMGEERVQAIEIIGYDASSRTYPTRTFDSQGNSGAYEASVRDRVWTFTGDSERAALVPDESGDTMTAHWERKDESGNWLPWMDIRLTRAKVR